MRLHAARVLAFTAAVSLPLFADVWDFSNLGFPDDSQSTAGPELSHGSVQVHDVGTKAGVADEDWYIVTQPPRTSWEATIDSFTGDIGNGGNLPAFGRYDASNVLVQSKGQSAGQFHNYLRFANDAATHRVQWLRVSSPFCGTSCGTEDQYTMTFKETTVSVPRFNNSATQVTVLIMMNTSDLSNSVTAHFLTGTTPTVASSQSFTLAAGETRAFNTSTVPALQGISGGIVLTHNGGYGRLAAKSVALEPATGFSFDTPGIIRP